MKRIYVETNFLMSVSTGRTPQASELLRFGDALNVAIPLVCFMEAHKAFNAMRAAKYDLKQPFKGETADVGRDRSAHAQEYARALAAADAALVGYLADSEQRLTDVIRETAGRARLVGSSPSVLDRSQYSYLSDPTDDMIAGSIIDDALRNPIAGMAFFSEDTDFEQPSLLDAMRDAGLELFSEIAPCLVWCRA